MPATPKPDVSKIWAENALPSNVVPPSDVKIGQGWDAEIPPYEWFNWLEQTASQMLKYLNERGISEWDANSIYFVDSQVMIGDVHYISLTDENQGNDPTQPGEIGTNWKFGFQTLSQLNAKIQFGPYDPTLAYNSRDVVLGSDGKYYECYKQSGTITNEDPTNPANRFPNSFEKWIAYDGVPSGAVIDWPGATAPEGYVDLGSSDTTISLDKNNYWRLAAAFPEITDAFNVNLEGVLGRSTVASGAGFAVRSRGGSVTHTHAATTASAGSHTHAATTDSAGSHTHSGPTDEDGEHNHSVTVSSHTLTINEIPSHSHVISNQHARDGANSGGLPVNRVMYDNQNIVDSAKSTQGAGGDGGHAHDANSGNAGAHTHTFTTSNAGAHTHTVTVPNAGAHTHTVTVPAASNYHPYMGMRKLIKA